MALFTRDLLLVSAGGDVMQKYGTWTRRLNTVGRGGEGLKESCARASVGLSVQSDGYYLQAQAAVPRAEWIGGAPYLLIEREATNLLQYSTAWGTAPWALPSGYLTVGASVTDPLRGASISNLYPSANVTNLHETYQTLSTAITAGDNIAFRCYLNPYGGYTGAQIVVGDSPSFTSGGFFVVVDLAAGTIVADVAFGTGTLKGHAITPIAAGWLRVDMWGTLGGAITAAAGAFRVFDTGAHAASDTPYGGGGPAGSYLEGWNASLEDNGQNPYPPTSPIVTLGAAGTRAADAFTIPFNVAAQLGLWQYADFLDLGTGFNHAGTFQGVAVIGSGTASWQIYATANAISSNLWNGADIADLPVSYSPVFGQRVQVLSILNLNTGNLETHVVVNGGAETVAVSAIGGALPTWAVPTITLGADRLGEVGCAAFKRYVVGLGGGTAITNIAQAAAVPV